MSAEAGQTIRFNGADYDHERDSERLSGQQGRIITAMKNGEWRTLREIAEMTGDPEPSISAQLRHLRKPRFGGHTINRNYAGNGLYQYQLIINSNR